MSTKFTIRRNLKKKSRVGVLTIEFDNLHSSLQQQMNLIDYANISHEFLKRNNFKLKSNSVVQQQEFYNLYKRKEFYSGSRESSLISLSMSY